MQGYLAIRIERQGGCWRSEMSGDCALARNIRNHYTDLDATQYAANVARNDEHPHTFPHEWTAMSVGHERATLRPANELSEYWREVHARAALGQGCAHLLVEQDKTTATLASVDSWGAQ